jgi:DNA replication protein DnaC
MADHTLLAGPLVDDAGDGSRKRSREEEESYWQLDTHQRAAFDAALEGRNLFLTGGPGTGKSHTLQAIVEALRVKYK